MENGKAGTGSLAQHWSAEVQVAAVVEGQTHHASAHIAEIGTFAARSCI